MSNARDLLGFKPKHAMSRIKTLFLLSCLFFAPVYAAQAGEALVKSEVEVDVTGKDAADAKEQAMAKAQLDGLTDLLGRLTTPEQVQSIISGMDPLKIAALVRGTEVVSEKISSNRYRAHLMVTFDGDGISNLIGSGGKSAGAQEQVVVGSFLIIPVYEEDGNVLLWEEGNPWDTAWKAAGLEVTSGDIVVPFGDNNDAAVIDSKSYGGTNYALLTPLTVRYGVSDVVILHAKYTHLPDMAINVVKRRINRTQNEVNLLTYRADPQETKDMLLARAARDIADLLERKKTEDMETVKAVQGGERNSIMLLANVSTLASWTQLRAKLSTLPMIDKLETVAIAPQQIDIVVHYRGTPESLANGITSQNIRLVKNPKYWVVSRD